ncbi:ERV/ALR sulfhydryl oxidase domain-containing protein [Cytidiella melzeri]|nr:ERV/ALR sulfhydryl oxidase domain-containing protein [Cytidiella melzeri]
MVESSTPSTNATSKPLPPGMIIGPDGKPCKICTSWRDWPLQKKTTKRTDRGERTAAAAAAATVARSENCPPDVEQLGRATWTFLHTTAAYYPEKPTPTQRANMLTLLRSLPLLYPCSHCATHLGDIMSSHPPDVSGRLGLSKWLCERHNDVNERLGKVRFECALDKLDERWKDGLADGSCD